MIPVAMAPEPPDFDATVRQPGQQWLNAQGIRRGAAPTKSADLPNYWTNTQKELWDTYHGICSYLSIYFEWVTGASSTDHFVPKSLDAWKAYEWDNYRLSALGPNRRKGVKTNILDPFTMPPETFFLNLASGEMLPNLSQPAGIQALALDTIDELGLNESEACRMRTKAFDEARSGDMSASKLQRDFPFVHAEMKRQGYLK